MNVESASSSNPPDAPSNARDPQASKPAERAYDSGTMLSPRVRALRVLVADDDEQALDVIFAALDSAGILVEVVRNPADVAPRLDSSRPDALVLGLEFCGDQGLRIVRELLDWGAAVPTVILARAPALNTAVEALRLGVADYLPKPIDPEDFVARVIEATERVHALRSLEHLAAHVSKLAATVERLRWRLARDPRGPALMANAEGPQSGNSTLSGNDLDKLSKREREVLHQLAKGQQAREIANALGVSTNTVRNHIRSLFVKLRVNSQLALMARLAGGDPSTRAR